jgi:membrane associated rhomboid family serine protease
MANAPTDLLEIILRECAGAQPHPWYPAHFAQSTGVARGPLDAGLDRLRFNGLVKLTEWVQDHGQGYQLTPEGEAVLDQPRLLARLRAGDVPMAKPAAAPVDRSRHALQGLRGEMVRAALMDDARPVVTQSLIALTCLWFLVGLGVYTARYGGSAINYLASMPGNQKDSDRLLLAGEDTGALFVVDVIDRNQWWRLLSYGFLHGGLLHLGMNMYALYVLGPLLEKMWGKVIFLTIYLLACLGGGAVGLAFQPVGSLIGASGAICGLLGSMATWIYLNRHYLPPHIVSAWSSNLMINVVLIGIISFMPGVSLAGHAGGGLTGAIISAPLVMARFGQGTQRWLGWAGAAALVATGMCLTWSAALKLANTTTMEALRGHAAHLDRYRAQLTGQPVHEPTEVDDLVAKYPVLGALIKADDLATEGIINQAVPVLNAKPGPLNATKATELQKSVQDVLTKLKEQIASIRRADVADSAALASTVKTGLAFFEAAAKFGQKMGKVYAAGRMSEADHEQLVGEFRELRALRTDFRADYQKIRR